MGIYGERPWLHLYAEGQPHDITPDFTDALTVFRAGAPGAAGGLQVPAPGEFLDEVPKTVTGKLRRELRGR